MFQSAVDRGSDPVRAAEIMMDFMQIAHWRSTAQHIHCDANTVHSILRAPRGDGKEAIVLSTPVYGVF